jgi:hypothetical protein
LKITIPKVIRNTTKAILILIFVCLILGVAYVYLVDKTKPLPPKTVSSSDDQAISPLPPATPPSATSAEGVALQAMTTPVQLGAVFYLSAETNAGSLCTAYIDYPGTDGTDPNLSNQEANEYGNVTWTWTVPAKAPPGTWPLTVTCYYHGRSGVVDYNIQFTTG